MNKNFKFKKLKIKNWKLFKNFEIRFIDKDNKPLPLVVIVGINGSGKTTILDALGKYSKSKTKSKNVNEKTTIELYCNSEDLSNSLFEDEDQPLFRDINLGQDISDQKISRYVTYFNIENVFFSKLKDEIPKYIKKFIYEKNMLANDVYETLSKHIVDIFKGMDLNITFSRMDGEKNLYFKNKVGKEFSIDEISTGEKTLLSNVLYLYLLDMKGQVILIDEPETSIHPHWQNKILKLYENFAIKNNCQIIIATHSPQIIGSAKNEYLRVLANDKNGDIKVIDNVLAYGRDIEWVLTNIMGTTFTRDKHINDKIKECQQLLEDEKYDEAEEGINKLEDIIGDNDSEILAIRNSLEFWRS